MREENIPTQDQFIALFPKIRFRYIHDVSGATTQGGNVLDMSWNEKGYGVFYTVNGFPSTGKTDHSQLLALNANYVDFDVDPKLSQEEVDTRIQEIRMLGIEANIPLPTVINRTKKGAHLIWLYPKALEPTIENITKWRDVQKRIVYFFKGDKGVIDPTRVLRLPGTLHLKDPENPFGVKVIAYNSDERSSLDELDRLLPSHFENKVNGNNSPAREILLNGVKVGEGLRHMAIAQVAGLALKDVRTLEQLEIARLAVYGWDRVIVKSPEPFTNRKKEIDNTIDGIWKRESERRSVESININSKIFVKPRLWTIGEILTEDFGEEEWLVDSLISKQGITALSGNPGDFKTWVTIHIALCISRNLTVFGKFQTTQGGVLIIDEEDHLRLLKKRLELLGAKETDNIHYLSQSGIKVDIEEARDMIVDIIKEKNVKLVILDSLVRVHQQEENDSGGMSKVFSSLQKIITAGASVLFTHHHRKQQKGQGTNNSGQNMRGSSDILAAIDCHIMIEKKNEEEDRLILRQTKLRQGELLSPFEVNIVKSEFGPSGFEYVGDFDDRKKKAEDVAKAVMSLLESGMKNRQEIIEDLKNQYGRDVTDMGIKLAEEAGDIERVPKEELPKNDNRKAYYRIPMKSFIATNEDGDNLPASVLYIEAGKQEDENIMYESLTEDVEPQSIIDGTDDLEAILSVSRDSTELCDDGEPF